MTNRKKEQHTPRSNEIKHYAVSAGELPASSPDANSSVNADSLPGTNELQLDLDAGHVSSFTEQRKARRFPVSSPATIRWLGNDGVIHEAFGMVRDISTCGLFVEASFSIRRNSNVELEIVPFGMQPESSKTELHFEGKIVRIQSAGRRGFAVAGFLWLAKLGLRIT